jgi:hypothetical protein
MFNLIARILEVVKDNKEVTRENQDEAYHNADKQTLWPLFVSLLGGFHR